MATRRATPPSYLLLDKTDPSTAIYLQAIRQHASTYLTVLDRLRAGEDVDLCGANGVRALHIAALCGAIKQIKHLLEDGADYTLKTAKGNSPLDVAYMFKQTEVANYLVVHHAMVRELTAQLERTPTREDVYVAMVSDEFRRFRADIKTRVERRGAMFVKAARRGDLELVRSMIDSEQVDVDDVWHETGETAFVAALGSARYDICEYLLSHGAHTVAACIVDGVAEPSIVMAVRGGDVGFVRRLVQGGVRLNVFRDSCALLEAVKMGSTKMIDLLLALKVPLTTIKLRDRLAMPENVVFTCYDHVTTDTDSWLLLGVACWYQDLRLVKHLLATRRALQDPREMANNGARPLCLAVYRENEEMANLLLESGADINQRFRDDKTALTAAVAIDSVRMLRFLVERGADPNDASTSSENAPLPFAVCSGANQCIHEMLRLEMHPAHLDNALVVATKQENLELLQLLLDRALPSTEKVFLACVSFCIRCPITLDLLLSRCCAQRYSIALSYETFTNGYARLMSADVVSVFLAHGLDVMSNPAPSATSYDKSLLVDGLQEWPDHPRFKDRVQALLKEGVPSAGFHEPSVAALLADPTVRAPPLGCGRAFYR